MNLPLPAAAIPRAARQIDPHRTRYPIVPHRTGHRLHDADGRIISFHRTRTGALRARREKIEEETLYAKAD